MQKSCFFICQLSQNCYLIKQHSEYFQFKTNTHQKSNHLKKITFENEMFTSMFNGIKLSSSTQIFCSCYNSIMRGLFVSI